MRWQQQQQQRLRQQARTLGIVALNSRPAPYRALHNTTLRACLGYMMDTREEEEEREGREEEPWRRSRGAEEVEPRRGSRGGDRGGGPEEEVEEEIEVRSSRESPLQSAHCQSGQRRGQAGYHELVARGCEG